MSAIPVIKRFTGTVAALNTDYTMTDDETALTFVNVKAGNVILDIVNDPDPSAGNIYMVSLFVGGKDTGRRFFSTSMSPASAGRINIGPLPLKGGTYQFRVRQTAGTAANYSIIVKFASDLQ